MPVLCSMFSGTYYAQNYASIIGGSLVTILYIYSLAGELDVCTYFLTAAAKRSYQTKCE